MSRSLTDPIEPEPQDDIPQVNLELVLEGVITALMKLEAIERELQLIKNKL